MQSDGFSCLYWIFRILVLLFAEYWIKQYNKALRLHPIASCPNPTTPQNATFRCGHRSRDVEWCGAFSRHLGSLWLVCEQLWRAWRAVRLADHENMVAHKASVAGVDRQWQLRKTSKRGWKMLRGTWADFTCKIQRIWYIHIHIHIHIHIISYLQVSLSP